MFAGNALPESQPLQPVAIGSGCAAIDDNAPLSVPHHVSSAVQLLLEAVAVPYAQHLSIPGSIIGSRHCRGFGSTRICVSVSGRAATAPIAPATGTAIPGVTASFSVSPAVTTSIAVTIAIAVAATSAVTALGERFGLMKKRQCIWNQANGNHSQKAAQHSHA